MNAENILADIASRCAVNKRLRIAVLTRNFSPTAGGAERYAIAMVEQLASRHDIKVFAQTIEHSWPNVKYHIIGPRLKRPRWLNQLWFAALTWWATRRGFDVVHSHENTWHGNVQTVHVMPVRFNLFKDQFKKTKLQRLLNVLNILSSLRLMSYLVLEYLRFLPRPGRQVIATSQMLRDVLAECYPAAAGMTSVVTPGIDLPPVEQSPAGRAESRRSLGLPQQGLCLLFVGNDFKKKGLESLIAALTLLPDKVFLTVVGDVGQSDPFKQQASTAGLSHRMFFLGSLMDMTLAYKSASCLVHPTREDTFAMVVLEAMAFGLPVIVSNAKYCGIAALLTNQSNALLLSDPDDASEIAKYISRILIGDTSVKVLGQQARSFAEKFDWPNLANKQESVYFKTSAFKPNSVKSL